MRSTLLTSAAVLALSFGVAQAAGPLTPSVLGGPLAGGPSLAGLDPVPGVGTMPGNAADVQQVGNDNIGTVDQSGGIAGSALIDQLGDSNNAEVLQTDLNPARGNEQNRAVIEQDGSLQSARIEQHRDGGTGDLDSDGTTDNIARIAQTDSAGAFAEIIQDDDDGVSQGGGQKGDHDNDAEIVQMSSLDAVALVSQLGDGNGALVEQTGADDALASVWQVGDLNVADVFQASANAYANVYQLGDGNNAFVSQ